MKDRNSTCEKGMRMQTNKRKILKEWNISLTNSNLINNNANLLSAIFVCLFLPIILKYISLITDCKTIYGVPITCFVYQVDVNITEKECQKSISAYFLDSAEQSLLHKDFNSSSFRCPILKPNYF